MTETLIAPSARLALVDRAPIGGLVDVSRRAPATVAVEASDPITRAGIVSQLRRSRDVELVEQDGVRTAVALLVVDSIDETVIARVQELSRRGSKIVIVVSRFDPRAILPVLDFGVRAVLTRCEANAERLVSVLRSVSAGGVDLPSGVLRHLIEQVGFVNRDVLAPRGLRFAGLTPRERDVLTLVAEGLSTREVATRMAYSERTIKNVLQDLTTRLQLRNRTQAVAYALRNGWI
jgi:DNA-binding NarL/FixJ family response regulator